MKKIDEGSYWVGVWLGVGMVHLLALFKVGFLVFK